MNPPDQDKRDKIHNSLDRCAWVEAGAGSGKTTELVARLVNLVAHKGVPLSQIAAITFTRKAAAELKTRAQDGLEKARLAEKDPDKRAALEAAISSIDTLFAETIHSFCLQILRERPLEAGVPPDFELMNASEEARVQASILHRGLDRKRAQDPDAWEELHASGIGPRELAWSFAKLCEHSEVEFPAGDAARPDFKAMRESLKKLIARVKPLMGGPACIEKKPSAVYKAAQLLDAVLAIPESSDAALVDALSIFKDEIEVSKKPRQQQGWITKDARMKAEAEFETSRVTSGERFLTQWKAYIYKQVLDLLLPLRAEVLAERIKLGRLTQSDLLRLATRLLREDQEVRAHLAQRFRCLFVDEFQDTDPIQAELMLLLTGEKPTDSWTQQTPRPGSLFVVGDPKQSIYRFRRADIGVYQQVKDLLLAAGAENAPLTATFRGQPKICEWVNGAFRNILPNEGTEQQAAFAPLKPVRACPEDYKPGVFALDIPAQPDNKGGTIAAAEAAHIARYIRRAVDDKMDIEDGKNGKPELRPARYGDFMIIGRTKSHLAAFAAALDALGIPNEVTTTDRGGDWDGLGLLVGLLKAVTDPDDSLAIVACLRGPLFGVSDEELFEFTKAKGRFGLAVAPEQKGSVARALTILHECWAAGRKKRAGQALETILERTGLLAQVRAGAEGSARAADLLSACAYIRARGLEGRTLGAAVEDLEAEFEENKGENIGRPPLAAAGDKVRIMNLHKAKGLEARVVFLVEPSVKGDHKPDFHVSRLGGKVQGYLSIQVKAGQGWRVLAVHPDWPALQQKELAFINAERDRLHYVATTRAKDFLVITRYAGKIKSNFAVFAALQSEIAKLPALKVPETAEAPKATRPPLPDLAKLTGQRESAAAALAEPTYRTQKVTDLVKEHAFDRANADWGKSEGPHGPEWGTLIHRALECLVRSGDRPDDAALLALVRRLAGTGSPYAKEAEFALPLLRNALDSDIWKRMLASPERYAEAGIAGADGGALTAGSIDLIFRVDGGWELVDYKTDDVGADTEAWVAHYRPQLAGYAQRWEKATGESVISKSLLFLRTGAEAR